MLPWGEMLRAALGAGIQPREFWNLSLREWRWLAGSSDALSAETLRGLMETYPDRTDKNDRV